MRNIKLLIIILLSMQIGVVSEASAKGHKLIQSVKFDGKVNKKVPTGNGVLIIEQAHEEHKPFMVNGIFNADTIKNASVTMNGSTLFSGDIKYAIHEDKEKGKNSVSFLILDGQINGMDVKDFGPITFIESYSYSGGFGKTLTSTDIEMKESLLTTDTLLDIEDRYISRAEVDTITYKVDLYYENHKWDSRSRSYYPVFYYTYTPIEVKYKGGMTLRINPDDRKNKYSLESAFGSQLKFTEYGEINNGSSIKLKYRGELSLVGDGSGFRKEKFVLIYPDDTKYTGSLQSLDHSQFSLPGIIVKLPQFESSSASDYKPQNGTIVYGISDGISRDEFINGEKRSVIEARKKRENEENERKWTELQKQEEAKEKAEFNKWVSQFGQKAAQAIKDKKPYVGMSEKAFRNISGYSLREENATQRVYVNYGKWFGQYNTTHYDPDAIYCIVVCSGGKIIRITKP